MTRARFSNSVRHIDTTHTHHAGAGCGDRTVTATDDLVASVKEALHEIVTEGLRGPQEIVKQYVNLATPFDLTTFTN